ncbi:MAG: DUF3849 domain-containing protein [Ruminococcaceae bacterium]|nr:DUF3849 domain-containing protein [Oscillospiraceae bacterium]
MTSEELNTALYEKMFAEQDAFRKGLLTQAPEEILKQAYEYTVREDILMSIENNDLTDEQASALLKSPSPLGDIFSEFESRETGYMEMVLDCITDKANAVIQMEAAQRQALLNTPVYKYPATYAREHNELEIYRASHKANIACRDAIDDAIRDNYRNNCLGSDSAKQVIAEFGFDRTLYVLAATVREKDWDGRIDRKNKDWARTIPVFDDENGFGDNRNLEFIVDRAHPGLVDLFINQARREYLLTQPLTKEDIQAEAARLLRRLQSEREPNSPSETHFMAQLSPDFLIRASTKDQDRLVAMLPFQSLTFSALKDRKGIFAFIQKDENRDQPLRQRKPSVRKKLENIKAAGTPSPVKRDVPER